jgi:hypothetical protein
MRPDEYQDLIDDPTGFFMNIYFPRIFGTLKPLEKMPLLPPVNEIPLIPPAVIPFGTDEVQSAFKNLMDVAAKDGAFILSTGAGVQGIQAGEC